MEMSPRKDKILSYVVRGYLEKGEPVSSKGIAEEIGVSSATVRNEMAELIELGLLEQPHTSAGRVPSQRGYREYVDRLMGVPALREEEPGLYDSILLHGSLEPDELLKRAGELLSDETAAVSLITEPSGDDARVRAVQLVQVGRRSAMLILMSSAGGMKSRVFHCDFDLSSEILRVFFRVFNEKVTGRKVKDLTPAFLQGVAISLGELIPLVGPAMEALLVTARDASRPDVILSGLMNLLSYPELEHRSIMEFLNHKPQVLSLLNGRPDRVVTLIGGELGYGQLRDMSVLVSRYRISGEDAGALAVMGPTRMDYARTTALLEYVSGKVGQILTEFGRD